jgi:hypothetical protein
MIDKGGDEEERRGRGRERRERREGEKGGRMTRESLFSS